MTAKINGRAYTAHIFPVGQSFGSAARIRVGSRVLAGATVPLGNRRAALDRLADTIRRAYPAAQIVG